MSERERFQNIYERAVEGDANAMRAYPDAARAYLAGAHGPVYAKNCDCLSCEAARAENISDVCCPHGLTHSMHCEHGESMSEKIEPALSANEWSAGFAQFEESPMIEVVRSNDLADREGERIFFVGPEWPTQGAVVADPSVLRAIISFANDALPDSDLSKITHDMVTALRSEAAFVGSGGLRSEDSDDNEPTPYLTQSQREQRLRAIADALESYLPPEVEGSTPPSPA